MANVGPDSRAALPLPRKQRHGVALERDREVLRLLGKNMLGRRERSARQAPRVEHAIAFVRDRRCTRNVPASAPHARTESHTVGLEHRLDESGNGPFTKLGSERDVHIERRRGTRNVCRASNSEGNGLRMALLAKIRKLGERREKDIEEHRSHACEITKR